MGGWAKTVEGLSLGQVLGVVDDVLLCKIWSSLVHLFNSINSQLSRAQEGQIHSFQNIFSLAKLQGSPTHSLRCIHFDCQPFIKKCTFSNHLATTYP